MGYYWGPYDFYIDDSHGSSVASPCDDLAVFLVVFVLFSWLVLCVVDWLDRHKRH